LKELIHTTCRFQEKFLTLTLKLPAKMPIYLFENLDSDLLYEEFLSKRTTHTQIIYITLILLIVLAAIAMVFIKIPLAIQGVGIIRPISEKTEVKSLATEIVEQVYTNEGQYISKGSPILKLRTSSLESRQQFLQFRHEEISLFIDDLTRLTKNEPNPALRSVLYQKELLQYKRQTDELQNKLEKSTIDYERNKKLYALGVIAMKEFEDYTFQYNSARNDIKICSSNQMAKWQNDLKNYNATLKEMNSSIEQLKKELDFYTIRAPVSGYLDHFSGLYPGSSLQSGETIAIISPDSTLISEFYISPKDIGFLNSSTEVRILVDAFYYSEWGCLSGKINSISSDYIIVDNNPMFRVRCSLNKDFLSLHNGFKGFLKKGMTAKARFKITERTLFQLLYQRTNDWLNPGQTNQVLTLSE